MKMSSTIVRVKRRLEETPADALVLHCKRLKTEEEEHLTPSVFVFSGTVQEKDHSHGSHIKKSWLKHHGSKKSNEKSLNIGDLLQKLKAEHELQAKRNRIKVVNCIRGIKLAEDGGEDSSNVETSSEDHCTVIDLHHSHEEKDLEASSPSTSTQYAYDLYLSHHPDFEAHAIDNIVRVDPYHGDLVFGSYRENGRQASSDEDVDPADEDSNDENNWRNEYPDTDESIGEEDMRRAMRNCSIDETLSSDEYDEDMLYGSSSSSRRCNGVDADDVERYGLAYARYKAKLANRGQLTMNGEPALIDVEEDECYSPANSRREYDSSPSPSEEEDDDC